MWSRVCFLLAGLLTLVSLGAVTHAQLPGTVSLINAGGAGAPACVPFDSNTVGLWHFDNNLVDASGHGLGGTGFSGTVSLSATQSKFGGYSLSSPVSGGSATIPAGIYIPGDFTIEAWIYHTTSIPSTWGWMNDGSGVTFTTQNFTNPTTAVRFNGPGGNPQFYWDMVLTANAWHHHAIVRSGLTGSNVKYFVDGVARPLNASSAALPFITRLGDGTSVWNIGNGYSNSGAYGLGGYIDEVRVSNVARYSANFTPQTVPFCDAPAVAATQITSCPWTVPVGVYNLQIVDVYGGGAGGSGDSGSKVNGGGGGSLSRAINQNVTPGQVMGCTLGAAGVRGQIGVASATNGGNTWFCYDNTSCANATDAHVIASSLGGVANAAANTAITATNTVGVVKAIGGQGATAGTSSGGGGGCAGPNGAGQAGSITSGGAANGGVGPAGGAPTSPGNAGNLYGSFGPGSGGGPVPTNGTTGQLGGTLCGGGSGGAVANGGDGAPGGIAVQTGGAPGACTPNTQGGGTDANVVGLWHFDNNLVDTANRRNGTFVGTAAFRTQSRFGGYALYSNGASSVTIPAGIILPGDFTIEGWVYFQTPTTNLWGWISDGVSSPTTLYGANRGTQYLATGELSTGFPTELRYNWTPQAGWHHLAIVRQGTTGNNVNYYVDGQPLTLYTGTLPVNTTVGNSTTAWNIGNGYGSNITNYSVGGAGNNNNILDEVRISNIARYTAAFTPQTTAFCDPPLPTGYMGSSGTPSATCTSCSLPGQFFGATGAGRYLLVGIYANITSGSFAANPISAVTIDGISATQVGSQSLTGSNQGALSWWLVADSTANTAGTIAFTSATAAYVVAYTYNIPNLVSTTPTATGTGTLTTGQTVNTSAAVTIATGSTGYTLCGAQANTAVVGINNSAIDGTVTGTNPGGSATGTTLVAPPAGGTCTFTASVAQSGINAIALNTGAAAPPSCTVNTDGGGTYANVIGLYHFDNATTDNSGGGHNGTLAGTAAFSTAQSRFGGYSLNPGTAGAMRVGPLAQMTGDFTFEGWLYFTVAPPGNNDIVADGATTIETNYTQGTNRWWAPGVNSNWGDGLYPLGKWWHFAWVRQGTTGTNLNLYLNGTKVTTTSGVMNQTFGGTTTAWAFGNRDGTSPSTTFALGGYLDEIRVSNIARYTANFTPPNAPWCNN